MFNQVAARSATAAGSGMHVIHRTFYSEELKYAKRVTFHRDNFYEVGKTVKFSINGIVIGEAPAEPVMTPIQLALTKDCTANVSSAETVNIVRFLMAVSTIDSNGNMAIDNSMLIPQTASQSINFSDSNISFANTVTPILTNFRNTTISQAVSHLSASIYSQVSGTYRGTYSGPDPASTSTTTGTISNGTGSRNSGGTAPPTVVLGTWNAKINANGTVSGLTSEGDVINGSLHDGTVFSVTAGANQWTGSVNLSSNSLTGTIDLINKGRNSGELVTFTGFKN